MKKIELKEAGHKYGTGHTSIYAIEPILKGEKIFTCDMDKCSYVDLNAVKAPYKTQEEINQLFKKFPQYKNNIIRFAWMIDDDQYNFPVKIFDEDFEKSKCIQCFINHSCHPTGKYLPETPWTLVATRDINVGEEINVDYQLFDTESILRQRVECSCGTKKCRGTLDWSFYRNIDWQMKNYNDCSPYIKKRINELKTKWFSSSCYLKYYQTFGDQLENTSKKLYLTVLTDVSKNELVAVFSSEFKLKVDQSMHYIRHDPVSPTCYLNGNRVYSFDDLKPLTEITLNYNL